MYHRFRASSGDARGFRNILFSQGITKNIKKIADSTNQSSLFLGPFSVKPLEEAGFLCPKLNFALRNPVKIAEHAQRVVQEGPKNFLDRVLRRQISILGNATNMAQGQLNEIGIIHQTPKHALKAATEKIPHGKYALFFIDNYIELGTESILDALSDRPTPIIFTGQDGEFVKKTM